MLDTARSFFDVAADESGASIVEFAILTPILLALTIGATDFARVFIEAQAVASASNSGVIYGSRRNIDSVNFSEMEARALDDVQGAEGAAADASMLCDCPANPGISVSCLDGSCPTYGKPRVYVKTSVSKGFETLGRYPGVPQSIDLTAAGYMRVQ